MLKLGLNTVNATLGVFILTLVLFTVNITPPMFMCSLVRKMSKTKKNVHVLIIALNYEYLY